MNGNLLGIVAAGATLLLGGCAGSGVTGNLTTAQSPAAAQSDQHTTAETGFGLGPEDYKTNGGAFGPDQSN